MSQQKTPFMTSVRRFKRNSPWLGPEHAPALASLEAMAQQLDKGPLQAALMGQFGLVYRSLLKERPVETTQDPLDAALDAAGAGEG